MRLLPVALGIAVIAGVGTRQALAQEVDGKSVYREECKECHGLNGTPPERAVKKYKKIKAVGDSGFVTNLSEDSIVTILKKGIDKNMKSFSEKLSEPEMHAVTIYIKGLGEKPKKEGT
jgi:mono/diheme cytochrome c family protein